MKKAILRALLVICGLNVFTACYGMPPGDWPEPGPDPEEESTTRAQAAEAAPMEGSIETDAADPAMTGEALEPRIIK